MESEKKSVHLVTLSDRPQLSSITQKVLKEYCNRHGYGLSVYMTTLDNTRHIAWSKVKALLDVMAAHNADYYVWVDDDILITRPEIAITEFVEEFCFGALENKSIMVSADTLVLLNTGLIILKPRAVTLLQLVWDMPTVKSETLRESLHRANWEQDCVIDYVLSKEKEGENDHEVLIVPYKRLQAFARTGYDDPKDAQWDPSVFSAHVTGMPLQGRLDCLRKVMADLN